MRRSVALGLILLSPGCARLAQTPDADGDRFRIAISRSIPAGTPVAEARVVLEREKFECLVPFAERGLHRATGNLVCVRSGRPTGYVVTHDWRVELHVDADMNVQTVKSSVSRTLF